MFETVRLLAKIHAFKQPTSHVDLEHKLTLWWSNTYNRPLKDPILQQYTLNELLYEFHLRNYDNVSKDFAVEKEADIIENERLEEALSWAEEEERKEREQAAATIKEEPEEPEESLAEQEWMQKEIDKAKQELGDDFGEDFSL